MTSLITKAARDQLHARPVLRLLVEPDERPGWFIARLESSEQAGRNHLESLGTQIWVPKAAGIVARSRQPLVDGARALLERGFDPTALLTMRHAGKAYDSFAPLPIAAWAGWTYKERDKGGLVIERWMPFAVPRSGQGTIPTGPAAVRAARTEFAPAASSVHGTAGRPAGAI